MHTAYDDVNCVLSLSNASSTACGERVQLSRGSRRRWFSIFLFCFIQIIDVWQSSAVLVRVFFFFLLSTLHFERDRCCHFTVLLPLFWFWLLTRLTSENSWYAQTSHIEAHRAPFQWNGIQSCFASPNTPTAHPFLLSHPRIICNICTNDKKYMYNEMLGSHRIVNVGHTAPQIHGVYKYSYQLYATINTKMNDL